MSIESENSNDAMPSEMQAAIATTAANQPSGGSSPDVSAVSGSDEVAVAAATEPVEAAEDVEDEIEEEVYSGPVEPLEFIDESVEQDIEKHWYILKVQVNREDTIREALTRRVKVAGLERYFDDIVVPTEDVAEFTKSGKRRIVKKKLYPGYIVVKMAINDDTWFLVRETSGIGDFTGSAGKPSPMAAHEIEKILKSSKPEEVGTGGQVRTAIPFKQGDRVRVKEGYFQNFEGDVDTIDQANGRVTVMINIFGRSTPVELEHWQIEAV